MDENDRLEHREGNDDTDESRDPLEHRDGNDDRAESRDQLELRDGSDDRDESRDPLEHRDGNDNRVESRDPLEHRDGNDNIDESRDPLEYLEGNDRFYYRLQQQFKNLNKRNRNGYAVLHAVANGLEDNPRLVKLLLDRGADVDITTPRNHTPLHFAVGSRKRNITAALIEAGASVNAKDYFGRTPMHFAISTRWSNIPNLAFNTTCDIELLRMLTCDPKTDLNPVDRLGATPLMWAIFERNLSAVEELLKRGANPNIANSRLRTPLHNALSSKKPINDIVLVLLENGAGIYCEDRFRRTPVDILIRSMRSDSILFGLQCIRLIALRHRIVQGFQSRLRRFPVLYFGLESWYKEVRLMKTMIVYDNVTLHDFVLGCCQARDEDSTYKICVPVVEMLLTDYFREYFDLILHRLSTQDLRKMLGELNDQPQPPDASHEFLLNEIIKMYIESERLIRHMHGLKERIKFFNEKVLKN